MNSELAGFWTLKSWLKLRADGHTEAYCAAPIGGFLHYSAEGTMAVSIFKRETAEILSTYGGRFEWDGHSVKHQAWEGWSPQGLEQPKVRHLQLTEDAMSMETDWIEDQEAVYRYRLEWQRRAEPRIPAEHKSSDLA